MPTQMYVITVAPIVRAAARTFSYFSPVPYPEGSVVTIPIRKHAEHEALVLESRPAPSLKSELRSATYQLRKLPKQDPRFITNPLFIQTLSRLTDYLASSIGAVLESAIPRVALKTPSRTLNEVQAGEKFEYQYFQEMPDIRHEFFKNHVRSSFAKSRSVIILAPTSEKVKYLEEKLSRGIEKHTFILHGKLNAQKQEKIWTEAREHTHPVLIISTPHFLAIPRTDLGTIIVEDEGSEFYEAHARPYLDFRMLAREYAHSSALTYIAADTLVRAETYMKGKPLEGSRLVYPSAAISRVIDMGKYNEGRDTFEIFSPQTRATLEKAEKEKVLLYVTRRGSYPLTQCNDCGTIVKCEKCNYPLVLYEKEERNIYRCHMCNRVYDTNIRCHKCHGWKLSLYGIALDRVRQAVEEEFPDASIYTLSGTSKENKKTMEEFEKNRGGVLITLSSGLSLIHTPVDAVSVISIDPLFAIPDIGVSENIARLLLFLRSKARAKFLIQVRSAEEDVLKYAISGDTEAFFEAELEDRAQFDLPPHVVFIKLRWSGRDAENIRAKITKDLAHYSPDIYSSFYRTKKGGRIYNALISLPPNKWPDETLRNRLSALPRSVGVNVNPESIL